MGVKGIDHRDGNGLDCRKENLRPASKGSNLRAFCRKAPGKTSRFRGVSWDKSREKWRAVIETAGIHFHLGRFKNELNAAQAYDKKAIELGFFEEALNFRRPA